MLEKKKSLHEFPSVFHSDPFCEIYCLMRFYVDSKVPNVHAVKKGDKYRQLPVPESSMVFRLSPVGRGY